MVWCVVVSVITFSCLVMGSLLALSTSHSLLPSLFVYGLRRCTASLELGDSRPYGQTELIIGIRDVHSEVSAWTSRTTLRWCLSVSRFMFQACDHAPPRTPGTLISQLDPSWFGLRPSPGVKGSHLRLDFKFTASHQNPIFLYSSSRTQTPWK